MADKYYVNNSGFHIHNYQYNSNDGSQYNNEPVEDVFHSVNRKMDGIRRIIYHNIIIDYNNIIIRIWINWYFLSPALRLLVTVQAFSNFFFKFQTFEILDTSLEIPSISIFKVWKTYYFKISGSKYLVFRSKSKVFIFDWNTRYFEWNTGFFIRNTRYFENMWQSYSLHVKWTLRIH